MSAAPVHYYVYYRVAAAQATAARRTVTALLAALEQRVGIAGRLLQRRDEPLLWMEVYEGVGDPPGFESALAELVDASDLTSLLAAGSQRQIERFVAAT